MRNARTQSGELGRVVLEALTLPVYGTVSEIPGPVGSASVLMTALRLLVFIVLGLVTVRSNLF